MTDEWKYTEGHRRRKSWIYTIFGIWRKTRMGLHLKYTQRWNTWLYITNESKHENYNMRSRKMHLNRITVNTRLTCTFYSNLKLKCIGNIKYYYVWEKKSKWTKYNHIKRNLYKYIWYILHSFSYLGKLGH